jgi:hypothetical protein
MIDQDVKNILISQFKVNREAIRIIEEEGIQVSPENFDINECVKNRITYVNVLRLIRYVYSCDLYAAIEMYSVIIKGKKAIDLTMAEEGVKKKTLAMRTS